MSATCEKCSGTGQLPGSEDLDCASCDVAMIRVGLETWAKTQGIKVDLDALWAIFKYGQSVALERAAICAEQQNRVGREWVKDSLWDAIISRVPAAIRALK